MNPYRLGIVPKLSRACVLLMALFITADAELCPLVCLTAETLTPQSSNVPAQPDGCGACSLGLRTVTIELVARPAPFMVARNPDDVTAPPVAPPFDIDHPPRAI